MMVGMVCLFLKCTVEGASDDHTRTKNATTKTRHGANWTFCHLPYSNNSSSCQGNGSWLRWWHWSKVKMRRSRCPHQGPTEIHAFRSPLNMRNTLNRQNKVEWLLRYYQPYLWAVPDTPLARILLRQSSLPSSVHAIGRARKLYNKWIQIWGKHCWLFGMIVWGLWFYEIAS